MNFYDLTFEHVEPPRPHPPLLANARPLSTRSSRSEVTLRPQDDQDRPARELDCESSTPASPPTLVPHAPTPPPLPNRLSSASVSSEPELYGPDRLFGAPQVARVYSRPVIVEGPLRRVPDLPLSPPNHPPDWEASFNASMMTDFRDQLARLEGVITPGVDDTPYIQYAIEALTRGDRDTGYSGDDASSDGGTPIPHFTPGHQPQFFQPTVPPPQQQHSYPAPHPQLPTPLPSGPIAYPSPTPYPAQPPSSRIPREPIHYEPQPPQGLEPLRPDPRASADSVASSLKQGQRVAQAHEWKPVNRHYIASRVGEQKALGVPTLNFRPTALRAPSLMGLMALCLLMIAAMIFSAVYSEIHRGILPYVGIYGGQYFLFRILPPALAAVMLLYAQFIITTILRTLPFVGLASHRPEEREGSLFLDLYPKSFLWPQLVGSWQTWVPILVTWLMNLTVPLHNSLFTVILEDGRWVWATVQGVAWTLVALYIALFASTVIVWLHWAKLETTGLIWDPRSLADITAIVSDTNTAEDYHGTQLARTREGIRFALRRRAGDRLGYWTWKDGRPGFWYTLGSPLDNLNTLPLGRDQLAGQRMAKGGEKDGVVGPDGRLSGGDADLEATGRSMQGRDRYLPWCLRNSQLLCSIVATSVFLLALFIVSFLPSTRLTNGFLPKLSAAPTPSAFSQADFLYSFLPSLLGTILFLLFQPLDINLRVLQPWATLSDPRGARAEHSLLVDYAACAPLQSTFHALRNGHWRVALISFLSTAFILIPVLAGATFMALAPRSGGVRMYPNVPAFAVVLALLALYLVALIALLPGRQAFRLPHAVMCLAEIIGFLANEDLLNDLSFKQCKGRAEMLSKMGLARGTPESQPRWALGVATEGGEEVLGIRRLRRFTEKRKVRKSQIRRKIMV